MRGHKLKPNEMLFALLLGVVLGVGAVLDQKLTQSVLLLERVVSPTQSEGTRMSAVNPKRVCS